MNPKELVVAVTKEDILWGIRYSCLTCPLARATSKAYPQFTVKVQGAVTLTLPWTTQGQRYSSHEATAFQSRFDSGGKVNPTVFILKAQT